ncbi:pectate lyase [Rhizobacter sp. LjRoot28]|jgi:hypothetical protein|uniref:pectate lyase n=1 Tax=Rhizobacter sp. LjRoot28 TaxID=3342309 RepID=UPI003ECCDAFF
MKQAMNGIRHLAMTVVCVATLAACGGGGSDGTVESASDAQKVTNVDGAGVSAAALAVVTSGVNLATAADGSSKGGGTSYGRVVDANGDTYWQPASASGQRISVKGFSASVGTVLVDEISSTVRRWRLVDNGSGRLLASGTTLGPQKVISFDAVSSSKLDLFIDEASAVPRIAEFEVYAAGTTPPDGGGEGPGGEEPGGEEPPPTTGSATGASCRSTGSVSLSETRVVQPGETFDGGCKTFNPSFGDGGQGEGQPPVFRVEKGGVLKNVIIGNNGADGVHIHGDATVDNVTWTDVGEDALTVKAAARVTLRNLTGASAEDKFFQLNAPTTFNVENIVVNGASKLFRENGGKCYPVHVTVNRAKLTNFKEAVFRSDCNKSTFALSNAELVNVKQVCYAGGKYASCGVK